MLALRPALEDDGSNDRKVVEDPPEVQETARRKNKEVSRWGSVANC